MGLAHAWFVASRAQQLAAWSPSRHAERTAVEVADPQQLASARCQLMATDSVAFRHRRAVFDCDCHPSACPYELAQHHVFQLSHPSQTEADHREGVDSNHGGTDSSDRPRTADVHVNRCCFVIRFWLELPGGESVCVVRCVYGVDVRMRELIVVGDACLLSHVLVVLLI